MVINQLEGGHSAKLRQNNAIESKMRPKEGLGAFVVSNFLVLGFPKNIH